MQVKLRQYVLDRDDHQCQLSKLFGIAELTAIPCSEDLEVHHNTYRRFGHEELDDGITVCSRCHEALTDLIRRLRVGAQLEPDDVQRILPERSEIDDGIRDYSVPDYRGRAADYAQRTTSRPPE